MNSMLFFIIIQLVMYNKKRQRKSKSR